MILFLVQIIDIDAKLNVVTSIITMDGCSTVSSLVTEFMFAHKSSERLPSIGQNVVTYFSYQHTFTARALVSPRHMSNNVIF